MNSGSEKASFIPYSTQSISSGDVEAVVDALRSEWLTQGPAIERFEAAFAEKHKLEHAVAVSNATAGLHIACLALGLKPGGLVWTTPISFVASANCAIYCGADIGFVDIDPDTRCMSPDDLARRLDNARRSGRVPDIVIPVDFGGLPCDRRELRALADKYGFKLLVDASHAAGATYLGAPAGTAFAHASIFSFHAVKIITTAEGGLVGTDDPEVAQQLRLLRSHGITRDPELMTSRTQGPWYYEQVLLGFNYRMTDILAALGTSQLQRLQEFQARREALADRYDDLLADFPLKLPARRGDRQSSHHLYVVEVDEQRTSRDRASVFSSLRAAGLGVNVHYIPIYLQPYYQKLGFGIGECPNAEAYYRRAISIPLFPSMSMRDQDRVVLELRRALGEYSSLT